MNSYNLDLAMQLSYLTKFSISICRNHEQLAMNMLVETAYKKLLVIIFYFLLTAFVLTFENV